MRETKLDMELVEYRAGDAFFEQYRLTGSDVSLVLPLDVWDVIGRPEVIHVTVGGVP